MPKRWNIAAQYFLHLFRTRLAVEAGATQGWHRNIGEWGDVIGLDHFGASAPGPVLMREYGFTVENVCQRALALLEKEQCLIP